MNESEIKDRVIKVISEKLDIELGKISLDASFIEDLKADSLDTVELIMAFEDEFSIEIPDEQAENIKTVGDVVRELAALIK